MALLRLTARTASLAQSPGLPSVPSLTHRSLPSQVPLQARPRPAVLSAAPLPLEALLHRSLPTQVPLLALLRLAVPRAAFLQPQASGSVHSLTHRSLPQVPLQVRPRQVAPSVTSLQVSGPKPPNQVPGPCAGPTAHCPLQSLLPQVPLRALPRQTALSAELHQVRLQALRVQVRQARWAGRPGPRSASLFLLCPLTCVCCVRPLLSLLGLRSRGLRELGLRVVGLAP